MADPSLDSSAASFGVGHYSRHIFICRGPECCSLQRGDKVWQYLKKRLKEINVVGTENTVLRSKVDCFQVCQNGPIVVIYPEGTWYRNVDEEKMERIIQSHIVHGKPLLEESFASNPLGGVSS